MPKSITLITVFLASPGDLGSERDVVGRCIAEWNQLYGSNRLINFDLIRWETSISAGFGHDGQDVINQQVGDEYDVLIALFWNRLGSETPRASSGTAEEYERALARFKLGESIEIAFYFKDADVNPREIDLDQLRKVYEFEKSVQQQGALSKRFTDDESLKFEINLLLDRLARNFGNSNAVGFSRKIPVVISSDASHLSTGLDTVSSNQSKGFIEEELGLFDISDNLNTHASEATSALKKMVSNLNWLGSQVDQASGSMNAISATRALESSDAKPMILAISSAMDRYSDTVEIELPTFSENTSLMASDIRSLIDVSYDFVEHNDQALDQLEPFRLVIEQMQIGMESSISGFTGMITVVKGLQRTTSVFNKARRRLVANVEGVVSSIQSSRALIMQAIVELDALIAYVRRQRQIEG
jgi:hypothetical protein